MTFSINSSALVAFLPFLAMLLFIIILRKVAKRICKNTLVALSKKRSLLLHSLLSSYNELALLFVFIYIKHAYVLLNSDSTGSSLLKFLFVDVYFMSILFLVTLVISKTLSEFKVRINTRFAYEERMGSGLNNNSKRTKIDAVVKLIYGAWLVFAVILSLEHFGVSFKSILAFGSVGSIILGFAAKDILSDLVSGFLIYTDREFDIGEYIKLEDPKIEGIVSVIGWRVSKVITPDDRPLYIPNSLLSKTIIQNVSRRDAMRIREYITLSIESAALMGTICKEVRNDVLLSHDGIDQQRPVIVNLASYKSGVCWIYISAFTRSADIQGFYGIKQDILIKINSILETHQVRIESPRVATDQI